MIFPAKHRRAPHLKEGGRPAHQNPPKFLRSMRLLRYSPLPISAFPPFSFQLLPIPSHHGNGHTPAGIALQALVAELRGRCEAVSRLQGGSTDYREELGSSRHVAESKHSTSKPSRANQAGFRVFWLIRLLAGAFSSAILHTMQEQETQRAAFIVPHPAFVATRKALAARPPRPISSVLQQAAASRKHIAELRAKGLPDPPVSLLPPSSR